MCAYRFYLRERFLCFELQCAIRNPCSLSSFVPSTAGGLLPQTKERERVRVRVRYTPDLFSFVSSMGVDERKEEGQLSRAKP